MTRRFHLIVLACLVLGMAVGAGCAKGEKSADAGGGLDGDWSLVISNYKNTCGGGPSVAKKVNVVQSGTSLQVHIEVQGPDGEMHTGSFDGTLDKPVPPSRATLKGTFVVGDFTTEETLQVTFPDAKTFTGKANWTTTSADGQTNCIGSQDMAGTKM